MHVFLYVCIPVCMHVMCACVYVMHACMPVCMYVCMHATYVYVYVCMYIQTFNIIQTETHAEPLLRSTKVRHLCSGGSMHRHFGRSHVRKETSQNMLIAKRCWLPMPLFAQVPHLHYRGSWCRYSGRSLTQTIIRLPGSEAWSPKPWSASCNRNQRIF
jgi:hypothetical protein